DSGDLRARAALGLLAAGIARIGDDSETLGTERFLGFFRHRMELLGIIALVGEIKSYDQLVLGIDGALGVVGHLMAVIGGAHQLGVGLAQDELFEIVAGQHFGLMLNLRTALLQGLYGASD